MGHAHDPRLTQLPTDLPQEEAARYYAAEVLVALEYLHAIGFIYRGAAPGTRLRAAAHWHSL